MRPGQIARAHQEFADDLAAGKEKRFLDQFHPIGLFARVMREKADCV